MTFATSRFQALDVDIHYLRRRGPRISLLGLHGLFGSGACLQPLTAGLDGDLDIVLPDARGHARSYAPPCGYSYSDLADDGCALVAGLSLDVPVLLGHSMGGMTACLIAARMGQTCRALVLVDPTFLETDVQRTVFESGVGDDHARQRQRPRGELLVEARQRSPQRPLSLMEDLVDARLATAHEAIGVLTPPNPDFRVLVGQLEAPTLLVTAEHGIVSVQLAAELSSLQPLLQHVHLTRAGHGLPYDDPVRVGVAVNNFLRSIGIVR